MLPKWHIVIGAIFSVLVTYLLGLSLTNGVIIFLSSILLDFDHYLYYIFKKRDLSLKNAYSWFVERKRKWFSLKYEERKRYKRPILIFHGIEFWLVLGLLCLVNKLFLWILLGIAIHMIFDWIELFYLKEPLYNKFSQMYTLIKNKKKEKLG